MDRVTVFRLIILSFVLADGLWLWFGTRLLREARVWPWLRRAIAAFVVVMIVSAAFWLLRAETSRSIQAYYPTAVLQALFLWHLVVLPLGLILLLVHAIAFGTLDAAAWTWTRLKPRPKTADAGRDATDVGAPPASNTDTRTAPPVAALTRRRFLGAAVACIPPALVATGVGGATIQLGQFRTHRVRLAMPADVLAPELDGLTLVHVSDLHHGRFTTPAFLDAVTRRVNELQPDLVVFTGDLIDYSLNDLPPAIAMLRGMKPRHGLVSCIGNHDLFDSGPEFVKRSRDAGIDMLHDDDTTLTIRGAKVQVMGLRWTANDLQAEERVGEMVRRVRRDALPILLAHHPHAFDAAASAGIPLTLAGHTHGGQLMLTNTLGPGPIMYRYWSDLYQRGRSSLLVSNGVGNWFPLRINAPAEITHVTLTREVNA